MNNIISPTAQTNDNIQLFETFFHGWLVRQHQFLHQLLQIQTQEPHSESGVKQLIGQVMSHYNEYYEAKSRIAHHNIFLVFSPPWFTSYERMFLWIAGFKPGLLFKIVNSSLPELTPEQARRMQLLVAETKVEETKLSEQLVRVQQEITAPSMVALARMGGKEVNGMIRNVDTAIDRVMMEMEALVVGADYLREKTVLMVIEILDAGQTVRFLAAAAQLQLSIRGWGLHRDAAGYATAGDVLTSQE